MRRRSFLAACVGVVITPWSIFKGRSPKIIKPKGAVSLPTGTVSLLRETSSGVHPQYSQEYHRSRTYLSLPSTSTSSIWRYAWDS